MAWQGSTRASRLPLGWPKLRAQVLRRDPRCTIRTHCTGAPSTDVDHVIPGDDHRLENLRGACAPCHAAKSGREGAQARHRHPRKRPNLEAHPGLK